MRNSIVLSLSILALFCFANTAPAAHTEWQDLGGGKARVLAVLDPATSELTGVVEIDLDEGWKTYWREPGGSGIPPVFDFSGSKGFVAGEIGYPTPDLLEAGGSRFAGYKGEVSFLFSGRYHAGVADLVLDLTAGVCEEICIPATASFRIEPGELMQSDPRASLAITMARSRLPQEASDEFGITDITVYEESSLRIEARLPDMEETPHLFAEGPHGWHLIPAELASFEENHAIFQLDISEIPADASPGTTELRYTLTSGHRAVEQRIAPEKGE